MASAFDSSLADGAADAAEGDLRSAERECTIGSGSLPQSDDKSDTGGGAPLIVIIEGPALAADEADAADAGDASESLWCS